MTRIQLMKIHALLAAFILPVAVMFMLTGALYTWGIKGSYTNEVYEVTLNEAIQPETSDLVNIARLELEKLGISTPEGEPGTKTIGDQFLLEWTGSSKDIILEPTDNQLVAKLTVKHTSWYRAFVQLHKAKGGDAFKVYAVIFAISIGLLLISGFMMAWQTPKLRRVTLITSLLGIGSFIVFFWIS